MEVNGNVGTAGSGYAIPTSVRVSDHAIRRFEERIGAPGRDRDFISKLIRCDVSEAVRTGRVSKKTPWWCQQYPNGKRGKGYKQRQRGKLVVWDLGETRAYAVGRHDNGRTLVVITVYKRRS